MNILVTGGAGYIGSNICVELLKKGHDVVIVDDLSNSKIEVIDDIETLTNKKVKFYKTNLINCDEFEEIFKENEIDGVIHLVAFKSVAESVAKPIEYYTNNLVSTLNLVRLIINYDIKNIVFSSSATVYGDNCEMPISENNDYGKITNPYGQTKAMIEKILIDVQKAYPEMSVSLLRYFNPIGAHESGKLGDDPNGVPENIMPYIMRVAKGVLPYVNVYGNDYNTIDGTGVRDYIHVSDLAKGHVLAIENYIDAGVHICNLGSGKGYSVLQLIETFKRVNNIDVPYKICDRRPGDIAMCYADISKAYKELGWKPQKTIEDMCRDSWNYVTKK